MRIITILLFSLFAFSSCKKDELCETRSTGELCITNQTAVTVKVWLDNEFKFDLKVGAAERCITLSAGVHKLNAAAIDRTTIWDDNIDILRCTIQPYSLLR